MRLKAELMDEAQLMRTMKRIAHEIDEKNNGIEDVVLLGVERRGVSLAVMLRDALSSFAGAEVPVGSLNTAGYRDDRDPSASAPVRQSHIPVDINGKTVIIVDDVIYTGRTARAAIAAILSYGRPAAIRLAVLIDRGHRELPIRPDFVGKNIPTSRSEKIRVRTMDHDGSYGVDLYGEDE